MKTKAQSAAYAQRVRIQTLNWAEGRSIHNRLDDECTPDFSCCQPELFETDTAKRWEYYRQKYGAQALN